MSYYWIRRLICGWRHKEIFLCEHCWKSMRKRRIHGLSIIQRTVRLGHVVTFKSTFPRRICLAYYDGKTGKTCEVIAEVMEEGIEVVTVWVRQGR